MAKLRQLLMKLTLEALVQILALPSTRVSLDRTARVDPVLIETSLSNLPAPLLQMASQWQQWGKLLCSPFDALILNEVQKSAFFALWKERPLPVKGQRHTQLQPEDAAVQLIEGSSVYKIATNLNVSVNNVVAWSLPYVKEGILSFVGDRQDVMTAEAEPSNLTFEEAARASEGRELRATIACIDDSKTVQKQVRGILGMSGYDVLGITEPAQALTALVRQRPAVILMDVNMPDVDGYELCSMLRQSRQLREIPIVMLTGRDGILDRLRAKTLGVEFYLTKPFDPERLLESIQKAIDSTDKAI
ncbi:MAG: response regulator [Geitlerinemataceae cyanobacterium]